jgi:hypothetical protein
MEKMQLKDDVPLIGFRVETFPDRIGEAFDSLMQKFPDGMERSYYGVSYCKNDAIVYWAMTEEKQKEEAKKYHLSSLTLKKGSYHSVAIPDWRSKTAAIKEVFHNMMEELHSPEGTHCIEWYKSDEEMFCLIGQ